MDSMETLRTGMQEAQKRMQEAQHAFAEAQEALAEAQSDFQNASQEFNSWKHVFEAETNRLQGAHATPRTPTPAVAMEDNEPVAESNEANSEINKTELVREILRQHPGIMPGDIWKELEPQIADHRYTHAYLYSVLKRLKDNDELMKRNGRYWLNGISN